MKDTIKKFAPIVAAALGALAILLFLIADAIKPINGWDVIFNEGEKFVFMIFLTVVLTAVGVVCSVLSFLGKGNFGLIAAIAFVVAAVFFFSTKGFYFTAFDAKEMAEYADLGAGAILAAILSIVAAVCAIAPKAVDKFMK